MNVIDHSCGYIEFQKPKGKICFDNLMLHGRDVNKIWSNSLTLAPWEGWFLLHINDARFAAFGLEERNCLSASGRVTAQRRKAFVGDEIPHVVPGSKRNLG